MHLIKTTFGSLVCRVLQTEPKGSADLAVVLCHGFGAPGEDLVPIGHELLARHRDLSTVRFVFPEAPIRLQQFGSAEARAWWPLDVEAMMTARSEGPEAMRRLRREIPDGLVKARRLLWLLIDQLSQTFRLPVSRILLGGFSQGSMLATDLALRLDEAVAALAIFSGTLLCEPEWRKRAPLRKGLRVLQTHGRQDPLLPFDAAEALRDLLSQAGLAVDFRPFDGPHTIPSEGIDALAQLIGALLKERIP